MDAYISNAALYCESCAPDDADGPYGDGGGEADCPQSCDACGAFLENPLTAEGRRYVVEKIREYITSLAKLGNVDVLVEWAEWYDVTVEDLLAAS